MNTLPRQRSARIRRDHIPIWWIWVLLGLYTAWIIYPMVWMAYSSLKTDAAIFANAFALPAPSDLAVENFSRAWHGAAFGRYFLNSSIVTLSSVLLITMLGAMASYALSRFLFPGSKLLFWLFLAGLMIPTQLGVVPLFFFMRDAGLLGTLPGLVFVYVANGLPFAIFVLSGFFRSLPKSFYEAAVIDGASEGGIFWKVMLPLARPGLVTVAVFQFIGVWKEYFLAFMLLSGSGPEGVRTLPLALANLAITAQYESDLGMLFAGLVIVTLPLLTVFLLVQKYLVKGIAAGALKG